MRNYQTSNYFKIAAFVKREERLIAPSSTSWRFFFAQSVIPFDMHGLPVSKNPMLHPKSSQLLLLCFEFFNSFDDIRRDYIKVKRFELCEWAGHIKQFQQNHWFKCSNFRRDDKGSFPRSLFVYFNDDALGF